MATYSISVARITGKELVDVISLNYKSPATNRNVILRADARVEKVTLWLPDVEYCWIVDADTRDAFPRIRRGKGETPIEALVALIRDLSRLV